MGCLGHRITLVLFLYNAGENSVWPMSAALRWCAIVDDTNMPLLNILVAITCGWPHGRQDAWKP